MSAQAAPQTTCPVWGAAVPVNWAFAKQARPREASGLRGLCGDPVPSVRTPLLLPLPLPAPGPWHPEEGRAGIPPPRPSSRAGVGEGRRHSRLLRQLIPVWKVLGGQKSLLMLTELPVTTPRARSPALAWAHPLPEPEHGALGDTSPSGPWLHPFCPLHLTLPAHDL